MTTTANPLTETAVVRQKPLMDMRQLNLAGPMTGLFIQPLIGALSDRT